MEGRVNREDDRRILGRCDLRIGTLPITIARGTTLIIVERVTSHIGALVTTISRLPRRLVYPADPRGHAVNDDMAARVRTDTGGEFPGTNTT